jgi:DNA-directed RNA polymerase specialized sigma24 family protein
MTLKNYSLHPFFAFASGTGHCGYLFDCCDARRTISPNFPSCQWLETVEILLHDDSLMYPIDMDSLPSPRKKWELSPEALEIFLAALDSDREKAGKEHVLLHRALAAFFVWKGSLSPEENADEVINRVCRKLDEGEEIRDVRKFCRGVARFILLEEIKTRGKLVTGLEVDLPATPELYNDEEIEVLYEHRKKCLSRLPEHKRTLLIEYHRCKEETGEKSCREKLAERLGIDLNALRKRVSRYKQDLEKCLKKLQKLTK